MSDATSGEIASRMLCKARAERDAAIAEAAAHKAEAERLCKLVMAVNAGMDGVWLDDVDGVNWFDARRATQKPKESMI